LPVVVMMTTISVGVKTTATTTTTCIRDAIAVFIVALDRMISVSTAIANPVKSPMPFLFSTDGLRVLICLSLSPLSFS
jgi:hypothetical protein